MEREIDVTRGLFMIILLVPISFSGRVSSILRLERVSAAALIQFVLLCLGASEFARFGLKTRRTIREGVLASACIQYRPYRQYRQWCYLCCLSAKCVCSVQHGGAMWERSVNVTYRQLFLLTGGCEKDLKHVQLCTPSIADDRTRNSVAQPRRNSIDGPYEK